MEFLAMRHGESINNLKGLIQGHTKDQLTAEGIKQIKRVLLFIKKQNITLILSSDLTRAKKTSKIISKSLGIKVRYIKLLREKDNGAYTGKNSKLIKWDKLKGSYEQRKAKNGESLLDVLKRVKKILRLMQRQFRHESILLITHGTYLKLMKGYLENKTIKNSIENTKITNCKILKLKC